MALADVIMRHTQPLLQRVEDLEKRVAELEAERKTLPQRIKKVITAK